MSEVKESAPFLEEQNLLDLLPKPKGIEITIVPDDVYNIPSEFDLSRFPENDRKWAQQSFEHVKNYIELPIISDNFPSAEARKNWRTITFRNRERVNGRAVADKFLKMIKGKISSTRINTLVGGIEFLSYSLPPDDPDCKFIADYQKDLNVREKAGMLDGPTTKARIEEVKDLSRRAATVLNKFAK